ncbi:hypothetical protein M408DRAFT_13041 [Serendipita vermifera MAFF 305830]|uniref:Uncharacterized protein n=1 Tax=Serendipita vermifera MAFF 305830 TaxID=933852 RepID=A0A0C2WS25_SERVB|nr:hypothetical protein M408DRAFT_13041 [Serendipita vermifera MAFF 305830]
MKGRKGVKQPRQAVQPKQKPAPRVAVQPKAKPAPRIQPAPVARQAYSKSSGGAQGSTHYHNNVYPTQPAVGEPVYLHENYQTHDPNDEACCGSCDNCCGGCCGGGCCNNGGEDRCFPTGCCDCCDSDDETDENGNRRRKESECWVVIYKAPVKAKSDEPSIEKSNVVTTPLPTRNQRVPEDRNIAAGSSPKGFPW